MGELKGGTRRIADSMKQMRQWLSRLLFVPVWGPTVHSYRACQFGHLLTELESRGALATVAADSRLGAAIKAYREDSELGWEDVCLLEVAVLDSLQPHELALRERHLRASYRSMADPQQFAGYEELTAGPADPPPAAEILRQRAGYLAQQLYWTYSVATKGHHIRVRVSLVVTYLFLLLIGYLVATSPSTEAAGAYSPLISAACFGAFGAYVSFQRRMSRLRIQSETYLDFLQLRRGYFDGVAALFSGALFAMLFIVLWQTGSLKTLLTGVLSDELVALLLPAVSGGQAAECRTSIAGLFACVTAPGAADFAKLMVASFLAGFAEQLIPDAIDSVVEKAQVKG